MHYWLVGFEERLHVVGFGLGVKRDIEHTLCPAFLGPAHALAQIVDGTPIGQSDDLVEVHLEEVLSHGLCRGLTLVERHPGESFPVTREVHISVVVRLYVRLHGQITG